MDIFTMLLLAVGLAFDAFAISISCGMANKKDILKIALKVGLAFGLFQAGMTIIGWGVGLSFRHYIEAIDHWIALVLLGAIGADMIKNSRSEDDKAVQLTSFKMLLTLSVATSIDAMAAGLSLATLKSDIIQPVIYIGVVTFILSFVGVYIGNSMSKITKLKAYVNVIGGMILIAIGIKIVIEHTCV